MPGVLSRARVGFVNSLTASGRFREGKESTVKVMVEKVVLRIENENLFYTAVGKLIRQYREEKGLSRKQFAAKIGISHDSIERYEKGHTIRSYELFKIMDVLGFTLDSSRNNTTTCFETCSNAELCLAMMGEIIRSYICNK